MIFNHLYQAITKTKQDTSRTACPMPAEFLDLKWAPLDGQLGFRRRRLGPNPAVGCAVCYSMKVNCSAGL